VITAAVTIPVVVSAYRRLDRKSRRTASSVAWAFGIFAIGALTIAAVALVVARPAIVNAVDEAVVALEAMSKGDADTARRSFGDAAVHFHTAQNAFGGWWMAPARLVPGLGSQVHALDDLSSAGERLALASADAAARADLRDLGVRAGQLDLVRVGEVEPAMARAVATAYDVRDVLDSTRSPWLLPPLRNAIERVDNQLAPATRDAQNVLDAVRIMPAMLGGNGDRTYLVGFVSPSEMRGSGGVLVSYAELRATNGDISMDHYSEIAPLVELARTSDARPEGPTDYLARYGQYRPWRNPQDITLSPDFPAVASMLESLYPQWTGTPIDGVMLVDPIALAGFLEFTGPITVPGEDITLTADNAADFLLREQYIEFGDEEAERHELLGDVAEVAFDRLTESDIPDPRRLTEVLAPAVRGKHLVVHAAAPREQRVFASTGVDGALRPVRGDYLGLVTQNSSNNKIDVFLHRTLEYSATFDPESRTVRAVASITLENDAPSSGLPDYVIGHRAQREAPPGTRVPFGRNRVYVSLYTPLGLEGASLDGQPVALSREQEAGRRVYSTFVDIESGGRAVLQLELAGAIVGTDGDDEQYRLDIAAQPTVNPDVVRAELAVANGWELRDLDGFEPIANGAVFVGTNRTATPLIAETRQR
jgi:hypothetical protein